jgi:hypothetical protein
LVLGLYCRGTEWGFTYGSKEELPNKRTENDRKERERETGRERGDVPKKTKGWTILDKDKDERWQAGGQGEKERQRG